MSDDGRGGYSSESAWCLVLTRALIFPGRVVFDHLPKTAGSAVSAWLSGQLGPGCVSQHLNGSHRQLLRQYGGICSILTGHITFSPGEELDPRYQYITLLREPYSRAISWLFYLTYNVVETLETKIFIRGAKDFLQSDGKKFSRHLLGGISNYYVSHFSQIGDFPSGTNREAFDSAVKAIKTYDVVGLYERMPRFLADVADVLSIPRVESIDKINETVCNNYASLVSEELRDRIMELNDLDIAFYEDVKSWKEAHWREVAEAEARTVIPVWE